MPSDFITKPPYNVVQPGAYSAVDASLLASPNLLSGRPIPMILGVSLGGQPLKPLYFSSPAQLLQVLRGGAGYDCARFAFDGGAPQVGFVRVGNSPTPATLNLLNVSAGTVLTLTSLDWGSWCNSILITVAAGPIITLTYTDAFGNVFTEQWNFTGVGGLTAAFIANAINGAQYGYNGSNYVSAVAGAGALPLANITNQPLAGGSDGLTPAAGDWTNGLTAIQTEAVDIVGVATGDATVHAQALTHCQNMSSPTARKERVLYVGGILGESVSTQTGTRMPGLQSARAKLVYPGAYDYNSSGVLTLYDPYYAAAKVIGMACALPDPATSLVHEQVPIVKAEVDLSTVQGGALDQLLQAGVTPISPALGGGYWVTDDLTGYNAPDQTFRSMNKTRSADFVAQYARASLEELFVGAKNLSSTPQAIQSAANDVMSQLQNMQIIKAFKPAVIDPGPNQNSLIVQLPVMLIDTVKFIFIAVQLQPSSTVQSSTTTQDVS